MWDLTCAEFGEDYVGDHKTRFAPNSWGTFLEILFSKHKISLILMTLKANLPKITDFELKFSNV